MRRRCQQWVECSPKVRGHVRPSARRISSQTHPSRSSREPSPGVKSFCKFNVEGSLAAKRGFDMDDGKQLPDGDELPRISTGNAGLDDILGGGIDPERMYLFEGQPGSGKTTLALEFLLEGVRAGEPTLYITLSETERELRLVAKRHGWSLNGITIFELIPPETTLDPSQELTVLNPADMELSETTQMIFARVEALAPARIVLDSLSELRLLAQSPLRYRRQILALKHFFSGRKSTVVLLDDLSSQQNDLQLHSIAHGVVLLEQHGRGCPCRPARLQLHAQPEDVRVQGARRACRGLVPP